MSSTHFICGVEYGAIVVKLEDKSVVKALINGVSVCCVDCSKDGSLVVISGDKGLIKLFRTSDYAEVADLKGHDGVVASVSFSQNSQRLVSAGQDETVRVWETATFTCILVIKGHTGRVLCARFSMDDSLIASCGEDETIRISNSETGKCEMILHGHAGAVCCVAFSPIDSTLLVSGSYDNTCRLWNIVSGELLRSFQEHTIVLFVRFLSSGDRFVSTSCDHILRLWNVESEEPVKDFQGHSNWVRSVDISLDETQFLSASNDGTVKLWDVESAAVLETYEQDSDVIFACLVKPRRYRAKPAKVVRDAGSARSNGKEESEEDI